LRDTSEPNLYSTMLTLIQKGEHEELRDFIIANKVDIRIDSSRFPEVLREASKKECATEFSILLEQFHSVPTDFLDTSTAYCSLKSASLLFLNYSEYLLEADTFLSLRYVAAITTRFDVCDFLEEKGFKITKGNIPLSHYFSLFESFVHNEDSDDDWYYVDNKNPDEDEINMFDYVMNMLPFDEADIKKISNTELGVVRSQLGKREWIGEESNLFETIFKKGYENALLFHRDCRKGRNSQLKRYIEKRKRDEQRGQRNSAVTSPSQLLPTKITAKNVIMKKKNVNDYECIEHYPLTTVSPNLLSEDIESNRRVTKAIIVDGLAYESSDPNGYLSMTAASDILIANILTSDNIERVNELTFRHYLPYPQSGYTESKHVSNLYSKESSPSKQHMWLVFESLLRETDKDIQVLLRVIPSSRGYSIYNFNGLLNKSIIMDSNKLSPKERVNKGEYFTISDYSDSEHKDRIKYYRFVSIDFIDFHYLGNTFTWNNMMAELMEHAHIKYGDIVFSECIIGNHCSASITEDVGDVGYSGRATHDHISLLKRLCFVTDNNMSIRLRENHGKDRVIINFNASDLNSDIEIIADRELRALKESYFRRNKGNIIRKQQAIK